MRHKAGLSEEGFAEDPKKAAYHVERLLLRGTPAAVCGHGPVLPSMLDAVGRRAEPEAAAALQEATENGLAKGEVLIAHLCGTGEQARVVDVERYAPRDDR